MSEELSALMDGELDDDATIALLGRLRRSEDERQQWSDYHLIGDALRRSEPLSIDLTARVMEALLDEPVVLAPPRKSLTEVAQRGLALAASIAGVAVVAALVWPTKSMSVAQLAQVPVAAQVPSQLASADLQAYLVAHQTHAPNSQGAAQYIKTVALETGGH